MTDLTTVPQVQAFAPDVPQSLAQALITALSATIETYCGRTFGLATYTEVKDGNGRDALVLDNIPIASITSVVVDGQTIPQRASVPGSGWVQTRNGVALDGCYRFSRGRRNVTITYQAGFSAIPADLAQACAEAVAFRAKERARIGQRTQTLNGAETAAFVIADVPPSARAVIDQYRDVAVKY